MAFGFMMIPAPTGLSCGARSRTFALIPRSASSRATERPPMPPPMIRMEPRGLDYRSRTSPWRQRALGRRPAGRRPSLQPIHRFLLLSKHPGIEPGGAQVALRLPVDGLDGVRARDQRELEFRRNLRELRHAVQGIAQSVVAIRVVVAGFQQRARDVVIEAERGKAAVELRKLGNVATVEVDAHIAPAFRDAALVAVIHGGCHAGWRANALQMSLRPAMTRSAMMITATTSSTWMKPPRVAEDMSPRTQSR